ncbi:MAG: hypothetical protein HQK99_16660 [Nitrospirae bacterium]|nr:hypothetical protein [Nitrospirota bacterium]
MAAIIDHMRVFTRRSEAMNTELTDINLLIEEPFKLLDQQMRTNGINVTKNLAPALPQIRCDVIRLEQVFINLITNARNAMRDAPKSSDLKSDNNLIIRTYMPENLHGGNGSIAIEIEDTGAGIPDAIKDKIFQPFFTTSAPGKGTGLGLSVSKKIIEEHGGTISVESTAGKGTIFRIILPVDNNKSAQSDKSYMEGERDDNA